MGRVLLNQQDTIILFRRSPRPRRRELRIVRDGFFIFLNKIHLSLSPSLLLSAKRHARTACSLASAISAASARYHRLAVHLPFSYAINSLKYIPKTFFILRCKLASDY